MQQFECSSTVVVVVIAIVTFLPLAFPIVMLDFPPSGEKSFLLVKFLKFRKAREEILCFSENVLIALRIKRHQKFHFSVLNNVGVKSAYSTVTCNKHVQNEL